jgi:hypothetical protein
MTVTGCQNALLRTKAFRESVYYPAVENKLLRDFKHCSFVFLGLSFTKQSDMLGELDVMYELVNEIMFEHSHRRLAVNNDRGLMIRDFLNIAW